MVKTLYSILHRSLDLTFIFINICKITINFLVKRLEMSGEELKKGFLRDDIVGFIFS